jgi:choline dehydrogenase-like flavoprotein
MSAVAVDADVIVIGSGPAGGVAALRAVAHGLSVLVLEAGRAAPTGPWFSFDRTRATLAHGGLFTPTFPSTLALGVPAVVGGGFAANSGFYHWVPDETLERWSSICPPADLLAARDWVESQLTLDRSAPRGVSAALLAATAYRLGLEPVDVPFWLHDQFDPRGPFLTAACNAGAVLQEGVEVTGIAPGRQHHVVHLADGSTRSARVVLLAAGAFGSFHLAASAGLVDRRTTAAGHVMVKSVLFPTEGACGSDGIIGRVQVPHAHDLRSGCALAEPWSLVSNHPEHRDEILAAHRSASPAVSWYTQVAVPAALALRLGRTLQVTQSFVPHDPALQRLAATHFDLCTATGLGWRFAGTPSKPESAAQMSRAARRSMVHITSTLPIGSALDSYGRFDTFPSIACCDVAALPTAPGVNPQAAVLALAKRNVDGVLAEFTGGAR